VASSLAGTIGEFTAPIIDIDKGKKFNFKNKKLMNHHIIFAKYNKLNGVRNNQCDSAKAVTFQNCEVKDVLMKILQEEEFKDEIAPPYYSTYKDELEKRYKQYPELDPNRV
jgi:hypothetical protein